MRLDSNWFRFGLCSCFYRSAIFEVSLVSCDGICDCNGFDVNLSLWHLALFHRTFFFFNFQSFVTLFAISTFPIIHFVCVFTCSPTHANSFAYSLSSSSLGTFNRQERNVNNAYAKLFACVGEQETCKQIVLWEMWKWRILFPLTKHQKSYSLLSWLLEETGYEKRQTSIIETTVLQFMLEAL